MINSLQVEVMKKKNSQTRYRVFESEDKHFYVTPVLSDERLKQIKNLLKGKLTKEDYKKVEKTNKAELDSFQQDIIRFWKGVYK